MPRGYLKHAKGQSRKLTRGGGSRRTGPRSERRERKGDGRVLRTTSSGQNELSTYQNDDHVSMDSRLDEVCHPCETNAFVSKRDQSGSKQQIRDCPICFESQPVLCLMKACSWHDAACYECLRKIYIINAQKSARNYPLQCFHPLCSASIRAPQLLKHGLIRSNQEVTRHHHMNEMGKGSKSGSTTAHCPRCDHPRTYKETNASDASAKSRVFCCRKCNKNFMVSPFCDIIKAMRNFGEAGPNDSWAQCVECKMLISKAGGDDDTQCGACGAFFSWAEAQRQSGFKYPFGRKADDLDPMDVLYLYW